MDCKSCAYLNSRPAAARSHAESGRPILAIINSSKTAWGSLSKPFHLKRKFGSEFVLVHISWSVLKKKNRRAKREGRTSLRYTLRCGSTVLAWSVANLSCELFGLIYPRQYVRLRYEDLVSSPREALSAT